MKLHRTYWLCQLAGWLGMVVIETINYTFFILGKFNSEYFLFFISYAFVGIISTHIFRQILKRTHFFQKKKFSIWLIAVISTFCIALVLVLISLIPGFFSNAKEAYRQITAIQVFGLIMNWMRYVGVWVIIYFMYKILEQNNTIQKEKLVLESLAKTTELELLKTQLNPHFLFNALNSIKALVIINPEQSRDAIVKLSELLRFTLQYGKERLIPVSDEMAEVKKYMELEQLRFGNRLTVDYQIDENTLSQTLPPAIVLTLAENAVKHGVAKKVGNSTVTIFSRIKEGALFVEVSNQGIYEPHSETGIGLKHITRRLEEICHNQALFTINGKDGIVTATIQTPLSWQ
jgi:LytS/YehU family sensor histidine kinase